MKKEIRAYVVNADKFDFRNAEMDADYKSIMNEAEKEGTVYSLYGFQEALNCEELSLDNSYVLIAYNTGEPIAPEY